MPYGGINFESKFAALEAGSDVDDELAALKAQISGNHTISDPNLKSNTCPVDDELEQLRQELNKM